MDSSESLSLLVVVPIVAWAAAVLVLRGRYQDVQRDWMTRGQTPPFSRMLVANVYGAVPVFFGLSLWLLSLDSAGAISGGTAQPYLDAANLSLWAGVAYATSACCTVAGQTLVVRARLSSFLGSDFGRVLPISMIPFTDSIFALVLGFLAFDYVRGVADGGAPATASAMASAISALQAYAVASLAIPVAAAASNRVRDLTARGFSRALMVIELGELPILVGLVMGFLAIGGLTPA